MYSLFPGFPTNRATNKELKEAMVVMLIISVSSMKMLSDELFPILSGPLMDCLQTLDEKSDDEEEQCRNHSFD